MSATAAGLHSTSLAVPTKRAQLFPSSSSKSQGWRIGCDWVICLTLHKLQRLQLAKAGSHGARGRVSKVCLTETTWIEGGGSIRPKRKSRLCEIRYCKIVSLFSLFFVERGFWRYRRRHRQFLQWQEKFFLPGTDKTDKTLGIASKGRVMVYYLLGSYFPVGEPNGDQHCLFSVFSGALALVLFNLCF